MTLCNIASTKSLTLLHAMHRDAQSVDPDVGMPAMTTILQFWRPRVARTVAVLHRGLRRPRLTREELTEQTLVMVAAQLGDCTARSDSALQRLDPDVHRLVTGHGAVTASGDLRRDARQDTL